MTNKIRNQTQTLIPEYQLKSNVESDRAATLFYESITKKFNYDSFSNYPDYLVYASAETMFLILPMMIDEMLQRKDINNFLVYPMISALNENGSNKKRAALLRTMATTEFVAKVLDFLNAQIIDPPIPDEDFNPIIDSWKNWKPSK